MNFGIELRTIFLARHGSHAYGLSTPESDEDFKGVCIKPKECYLGFMQRFEQQEHKGGSDNVDSVIYSLDKFAALAADCNPSIIEVLWVDDSDVLTCDAYGELLRAHRADFLSKKARFTFSGYAHAQLKRIKTHRAWLLDPPKAPPSRKDFGLSETHKISASELGAANAVFESPLAMIEAGIGRDIIHLFVQENAYHRSKVHYDQYLGWIRTRNPKRASLETRFGFDTKHGMHLIRLMRMCKEILVTGKVLVKRPDRDELLAVRSGAWKYDQLIEQAEGLEAECEVLYGTSILPKEPNRAKLDAMIVDMTERYLRDNG